MARGQGSEVREKLQFCSCILVSAVKGSEAEETKSSVKRCKSGQQNKLFFISFFQWTENLFLYFSSLLNALPYILGQLTESPDPKTHKSA